MITVHRNGAPERRLLVVNSNASAHATARIARVVEAALGAGTRAVCVNPENGPEGIDSILDIAVSGLETVRLVAEHRDRYDAFVIACGNDPGLDAARQVTDRPVVGIAEAGMLYACPLGARFSIPVLSESKVTLMEELVAHYGLRRRLASVVPLEVSTAELLADPGRLHDELLAAALVARDRDRAEVIVLVGSVMGEVADSLAAALGIPVVSGLAAAVKLAESLADLRLRTSHRHTYRTPEKRDALLGHPALQPVYSLPAAE